MRLGLGIGINRMVPRQGSPYSSVKFLSGFEGADAATTTADESLSARTITFFGNAQLDTAQSKFGSSSLLLDGSGDYLDLQGGADFDFGTGDYTMEMWVRPSALTSFHTLLALDVGTRSFVWYINASSGVGFEFRTIAAATGGAYNATPVATGVWTHLAIVRKAGVQTSYVGGQPSATQPDTAQYFVNAGVMKVGRQSAGSLQYAGWIDEIRITKGVALYDGAFTPPTSSFPRS
jgi:Concanavalin A-like lectin/glucanases superfamily